MKVEGPKGKLELNVHPLITVKLRRGQEGTGRHPPQRREAEQGAARPDPLAAGQHGRSASARATRRSLEIQGVGYKAEQKGKNLVLSVGYANTIPLDDPAGVDVQLEGPTKIHVTGPDKQAVGQFASDIRRVRKPEPYKGKGIRYEGEVVKIKPGKAFAGAGAK